MVESNDKDDILTLHSMFNEGNQDEVPSAAPVVGDPAMSAQAKPETGDTGETEAGAEPNPEAATTELPAVPGVAGGEETEGAKAEPVEAALAKWRHQIQTEAGKSPLRDLRVIDEAYLDLTAAHPSGMAQLLSSRPTHLSSLLRSEETLRAAKRVARRINEANQSSLARNGVYPTFLVVGVASWTQLPPRPETERPFDLVKEELLRPETFNAPVLLRPLHLSEERNGDFVLTLDGPVLVNPVLVEVFRARGLSIDTLAVARGCLERGGFTPSEQLEALRRTGQERLPGFDLREEMLVGPFLPPLQVLAGDFDRWEGAAGQNPVVRALAGDEAARAALLGPLPTPPGTDRQPDLERGIGDLDPSQLDAIEAVAAGLNIMVDVPPGAPGAATAVAMIADAAASGRQVWYLPGVRRRGKRVLDALRGAGLGDYLSDLTGKVQWREALATSLRGSLAPTPVEIDAAQIQSMRADLAAARQKLESYTNRLHLVRQPWGVSAYDALQALADLTSAKPGPRTKVHLDFSAELATGKDARAAARELLMQAASAGFLDPDHQDSAWKGAVLSTRENARAAVARVQRLHGETLPRLRKLLLQVEEETGLVPPPHLQAWNEQLGMLRGLSEALDIFQPEIFEHSAADMMIATASAQWRRERSIPMGWRERRRLIRRAKDLLRPGVSVSDLHARLAGVQGHRDVWQRHALPGAWPRLPQEYGPLLEVSEQVNTDIEALQAVLASSGRDLDQMPFGDLETLLGDLAGQADVAERLPEEVALLKALHDLGLDPLLADLRQRRVPAELALAELDLAWWAAVLTDILATDPALAGCDGEALRELAATVRELDLAQVESLPGPIRRAISARLRATVDSDPDQAASLFDALDPALGADVVDILARYPLAAQMRPIWALPPLLMPQLLPETPVDLLILDHFDHLPLAQVIPLLARAKQVVVLGDSRRPWSGFTRQAAKVLPRITLDTGRAGLSEQVATFLADHGYADVLTPLPSPRPASLVRLEVVDGRRAPDAGDGVQPAGDEVEKVVELVLDHALRRPSQSLAVITLNPAAAGPIRKAIEAATANAPAVQDFFAGAAAHGGEAFVVVDSATAAGLRRDCVILALGYPKTPHDRVLHNFGPINSPSGVAHLVDALEVVRQELIVVSSFSAEQTDESKLNQAGPRMLVDLLRAAGEPVGMSRALVTPSSFESEPDRLLVDLAERLWRRGVTIVPRFGMPGGVKVPLAVGHADLPAELLVAVLSDDANYIAEPSLRRRERYWPQMLEAAGWRVITVYSTQVFADPQGQADLVVATLEEALAERQRQLAPARARGLNAAEPGATGGAAQSGSPAESGGAGKAGETAGQQAGGPAAAPEQAGAAGGEDQAQSALPAGRGHEGGKTPSAGDVPTVIEAPEADMLPAPGPAGANAGGEGASGANGGSAVTPLPANLGVPRGPRPPVAPGLPLAAYGDDQLDELLEWICSDLVVRSEDEQVAELRQTLGLARRGGHVDSVLRNVVRRRAAAL